jgi:hypothetical protein
VHTRAEWLAVIDLDVDALFMPFWLALDGCDLFDDGVLAAAYKQPTYEADPADHGWLTCTIVQVAVNGVRAVLAPVYDGYSGVGLHVGAASGVGLRYGRWFREGEAIIPELWTDENDEEEA